MFSRNKKVIVVIPARGGSKGIPRKNLRPVAGQPLISYSIRESLKSKYVDDVIVSTDDDEIALFAERFGARCFIREKELANDDITLDPVITAVFQKYLQITGNEVEIVITVQPTSPLIKASDLDKCVESFLKNSQLETVVSVVDDRHLCWTFKSGKATPTYEERVNRQQLKENFRETGAIIACRSSVLENGSRFGEEVELLEMPQERSFDIDSVSDLYLCESILKRKRILFAVVGHASVGLGHAYRALMLANELVRHEIMFICERSSMLAAKHITDKNYPVIVCEDGTLVEEVKNVKPDLVINDILDTSSVYINDLKTDGIKVVNFEDLGDGFQHADLVINALYPNELPFRHVKVGHRFFCLRDEFLFFEDRKLNSHVKNILISFGGVDEGNLTHRVTSLLLPYCKKSDIKITVVLGPGYSHQNSLSDLSKESCVDLISSTSRMSDYMVTADLAITSGGRTVFELAAMQVPTVVICQNERETTHTFASSENGVVNLGLRTRLDDQDIVSNVVKLCSVYSIRENMVDRMRDLELRLGKERVCKLIEDLLG